jgi:hypothetical protein
MQALNTNLIIIVIIVQKMLEIIDAILLIMIEAIVDERSTYESVWCIQCLIDGVRCLRDAILGGIMKYRDSNLNTASNGNN